VKGSLGSLEKLSLSLWVARPETEEDPPAVHEPGAGSSLDLSSPAGPSAGDFSHQPFAPEAADHNRIPDDRKTPQAESAPGGSSSQIVALLFCSFALLIFCSFASHRRPRLCPRLVL
jgi:hypothetical protein